MRFLNPLPRQDHNGRFYYDHAPLKFNTIGTYHERKLYPKFHRLHKLNLITSKSGFNSFKNNTSNELVRILSILNLPQKLYHNTKTLIIKFYKQFTPYTDNRSPIVLTPVVLYIVAKSRFIFINKKKFKEILLCNYNKFRNCFKAILTNNHEIQEIFRSPEFRKKFIMNILSGINIKFQYSSYFIPLAQKYLNKYFDKLHNQINTVIVIHIWYLTVKELQGEIKYGQTKRVCSFLGIKQSCLSNHKKKLESLTLDKKNLEYIQIKKKEVNLKLIDVNIEKKLPHHDGKYYNRENYKKFKNLADMISLENHKLAKQGDDYLVIIPRKLIKHNIIKPKIRYNIFFDPIKKEELE